ncbi:MAG: NAD(P)H-hydrate dehydratase [Planctomycetes bacterium]|nr:NAD(P)H-hydrate dehydratase [Planctomycetota bacterium]
MAGMKFVQRVPRLPRRARDAHKGDFGTVLVVAGSESMLGAAILCARGALRGGAGLARVALPAALQPLLPLGEPNATTVARAGRPFQAALRAAGAVVVGPGLGTGRSTRALVRAVLATGEAPAVLDADALNVLAPLRAPLASRRPLVLTPHPGEAARLLGTDAASVQRDRAAALRELCARSGAIVVLKGAGTLVGDGAWAFRNKTGNPGMATGGSGDVLAGLLGALLARGLPPFDAACLAVHVHGRAGDRIAARLSEHGLCASDLPLAIAEELR